jgi:dipeptidyl aminopeptidase/acylaminoacyl peptidase
MKKIAFQPIDRFSLSLILVLSLLIGLLVWGGKSCGTNCFLRTGPHIRDFSWENQEVGSEDTAFTLIFDRPMDRASVWANLKIEPPLPGKISWAGRKLAYTLETPVPYGETYRISLQGAREHFRGENKTGQVMQPFFGQFRSRDRAFAYIGIQGQERGRLILYNLTKKQKTILTPANLVVTDFKFYPKGDKILLAAAEKKLGFDGLRQLQLYTITTEIDTDSNQKSEPKLELILDNQDYQNNQFDLSADGKTIVIQRLSRKNPADFDLWLVKPKGKPEKLNSNGGKFLIAPDSQTLAVSQGEGIGILPLQPNVKPLDFLPKFSDILSFSRDGSAAAMVNFNTDNANLRYLRSLFYVNNQGIQKELLRTEGSIMDCQFNPKATELYCLLTKVLPSQDYQEQPYFAKINLKTGEVIPLAALPKYQNIKLSFSPDGLAILFDQLIVTPSTNESDMLTTNSGETIIGGSLWLLIPPNSNQINQPELTELPLVGFHPQWVP